MRGFKLNTAHDLSLDAGGRLEAIDGDAATAQEIRTRLLFFRGESFLDSREGTPWWTEILVKGVDLARVRAIVRAVIASVPSIVDVPEVEVTLDRSTRAATIRWVARSDSNRLIRSDDFPALIVPAA